MGFPFRSITKFTYCATVVVYFLSAYSITSTDALDPKGNITIIKWDVMDWTPDGYVAAVTITDFQKYGQIGAPGWSLGWTWAKKEVIWSIMGCRITGQGDCSSFKGNNIPRCCKKNPTVVDLLPGAHYHFPYCCKLKLNPKAAVSSFQLSVGVAGTSNTTVKVPMNFTLKAVPGPFYTCSPTKIVRPPTKFVTSDGRRVTQAMMTWNATCTKSFAIHGSENLL